MSEEQCESLSKKCVIKIIDYGMLNGFSINYEKSREKILHHPECKTCKYYSLCIHLTQPDISKNERKKRSICLVRTILEDSIKWCMKSSIQP